MNSLFHRHHTDAIRFGYQCFDRILCNVVIQHLQVASACHSFLRHHRQAATVSAAYLKNISSKYHEWLEGRARDAGIPLVEPPRGVRRQDWVQPFFQQLDGSNGVAVILKTRERAKMVVSNRVNWLDMEWRYVYVYYLYLQHAQVGRMHCGCVPTSPSTPRCASTATSGWGASCARRALPSTSVTMPLSTAPIGNGCKNSPTASARPISKRWWMSFCKNGSRTSARLSVSKAAATSPSSPRSSIATT